jgi:hypothetical protein
MNCVPMFLLSVIPPWTYERRNLGTLWGHNYVSHSIYTISFRGITYREGLGTLLTAEKSGPIRILSPLCPHCVPSGSNGATTVAA